MNGNNYLNEGTRPFYVHFKEEHEAVDDAIHDVQSALNDPAQPLTSQQIGQRLIQLRAKMSEHFREEEEGCFDEICARQPHMSTEAIELEKHHRMLLSMLDELILDVDESHSSDHWRNRFNRFERDVMSHEEEERALVRRGLMLPEEDA